MGVSWKERWNFLAMRALEDALGERDAALDDGAFFFDLRSPPGLEALEHYLESLPDADARPASESPKLRHTSPIKPASSPEAEIIALNERKSEPVAPSGASAGSESAPVQAQAQAIAAAPPAGASGAPAESIRTCPNGHVFNDIGNGSPLASDKSTSSHSMQVDCTPPLFRYRSPASSQLQRSFGGLSPIRTPNASSSSSQAASSHRQSPVPGDAHDAALDQNPQRGAREQVSDAEIADLLAGLCISDARADEAPAGEAATAGEERKADSSTTTSTSTPSATTRSRFELLPAPSAVFSECCSTPVKADETPAAAAAHMFSKVPAAEHSSACSSCVLEQPRLDKFFLGFVCVTYTSRVKHLAISSNNC